MSPKNIVESVLDTIRKDHIQPRPKWEFMLKKYVIWALTALTLIVGSLAFAVIIYLVKNNDWDLYSQAPTNFPQFILLTLPYFWLIFLVLFVFLVYYNFRHTKKGYKYGFTLVIGATILLSIITGTLFYYLGFGQTIDQVFDERLPIYRELMKHRQIPWQRPEQGLIFGNVNNIYDDYHFELIDLNRHSWQVIYSPSDTLEPITFTPGMRLKLFGRQTSPDNFEVEIIRPAGPPPGKMFFIRPKPPIPN